MAATSSNSRALLKKARQQGTLDSLNESKCLNLDSADSNDSDADSERDEITPEYLNGLLAKAKANIMRQASEPGPSTPSISFLEDEVPLDDGDDSTEEKLPSLDPGQMYKPYFTLGSTRHECPSLLRDLDAERAEQASSSSAMPAPPLPPKGITADGKRLTKKEIKALKSRTAGPSWFDLPAPEAADLPRLYREVEALRLRNQLDPKRFYRKEEGEGKGIKGLPKHFAIGTIVNSSTPFGTMSSDNLTRAERKRTIVDELIDDAEAKSFAKRKFTDLQDARAAKGRGTLAKRKALRKPKW